MSETKGTCNLEQDVPHTAGSDCRDWNPWFPPMEETSIMPEKSEPINTKTMFKWDSNTGNYEYAKDNTYESLYADLKEKALKEMSVPEATTECRLTLAEQVEGLETRYKQESAWLNEAAKLLNCDLDRVAYIIRTNLYRASWKMPPLQEQEPPSPPTVFRY